MVRLVSSIFKIISESVNEFKFGVTSWTGIYFCKYKYVC